jgi:hypothetical protein
LQVTIGHVAIIEVISCLRNKIHFLIVSV